MPNTAFVMEIVAVEAALAMPKSVTFKSPEAVTSTLWGMKSRWTTPRLWTAPSALAIWKAMAVASRDSSGLISPSHSLRVPPGTYSIAM